MDPTVLALIEDSIGTQLVLTTRLKSLGYRLVVVSAPEAFQKRVEAEGFAWIILDAAAMPPVPRRFLRHLHAHRRDARVVWLGIVPRRPTVAIEVSFAKPLRYGDIERFFAQWAPTAPAR